MIKSKNKLKYYYNLKISFYKNEHNFLLVRMSNRTIQCLIQVDNF